MLPCRLCRVSSCIFSILIMWKVEAAQTEHSVQWFCSSFCKFFCVDWATNSVKLWMDDWWRCPVHLRSLKAVLSAPLSSGTLDLSGIPLTTRDMERLCSHLQRHAATVVSLELGFTELTDEAFLLLLPTLAALPHLETLALNGNRLTRTILKELTDALKVRKTSARFFFFLYMPSFRLEQYRCYFKHRGHQPPPFLYLSDFYTCFHPFLVIKSLEQT